MNRKKPADFIADGDSLRSLIRWLQQCAYSVPILRNLFYDVYNAAEFTSLYEHEQMIADRVRVDTYHAGIHAHIKKGDVVIDLGTGSGILALFAEQAGAKKIYALDHSEFISVARRLAKANGSKNIEFIKANSRSVELPQRADVLIHEQLGDDLFDENMIENLLDTKRRLLKPNGRILPGRFELYLEPVQLNQAYRVPYFWENNLHGIDYSGFKGDLEIAGYKKQNYEARYLWTGAVDQFLSEPAPILAFDLNQWKKPSELPNRLEASRTMVTSGTMDGFVLYFRALFDDDIHFSTSPKTTRTHWANRLFRTKQRTVKAGENLSWSITLTDPLYAETWQLHVD